MSTEEDVWGRLSEEVRQKLEYGNECFRILKRGETIERWYAIGVACDELQKAAMALGGTNQPTGRAYRDAWAKLADHVPDLRTIDPADRSNAIWMVENWPSLDAWLRTQAVNVRLRLNHPRSLRRKYEQSTQPPKAKDETETSPRVQMQDRITQLQEKLDALMSIKTAGAKPATMSWEDYVDTLSNQMSADAWRKFAAAVAKKAQAEARQDRIEEARLKRKK